MFMDLSTVHLHYAVAAQGKTAIVRGHEKRYALGSHDVVQKVEDHFAVRWRSPPESF